MYIYIYIYVYTTNTKRKRTTEIYTEKVVKRKCRYYLLAFSGTSSETRTTHHPLALTAWLWP